MPSFLSAQFATVVRSRAATGRGWLPWLLLVAWFAATAWVRPLAVPDEGRYLSVAWEMLGGNWLVPTLDGMPFFHKPPLFYWLAAAAMRLGGVSAFAGRVPSILAAATLVWAMYRFAMRWTSAYHARVLLPVLATTPYIYIGAQYANMDMLVAACIGASILLAAHSVLRMGEGMSPGPALGSAFVMAGLGVLAKGLIGCVLPAGVIVLWLAATRQLRLLPRLLSPWGFMLFFAVALPWPLAMQARYSGFLDYFIVEQHFHRFAGSGFNNAQPWWFYVAVVFVLTLPWSALVPRALARVRRDGSRAADLRVLMACWAALVIVFFSIPDSKLIGYGLPAAAPLAWLFADAIAAGEGRWTQPRHLRVVAAGISVVLVAAVGIFALRAPHSAQALAAQLRNQREAGDAVVFVDAYPYDLVFDARLRPPIAVVEPWSDPELSRGDSWPRELLDEARFAPRDATARLVQQVPVLPNGSGRTWIVSPAHTQLPAGLNVSVVATTGELILWRTEP